VSGRILVMPVTYASKSLLDMVRRCSSVRPRKPGPEDWLESPPVRGQRTAEKKKPPQIEITLRVDGPSLLLSQSGFLLPFALFWLQEMMRHRCSRSESRSNLHQFVSVGIRQKRYARRKAKKKTYGRGTYSGDG
jgi:hypothetical protein